MFGNDFEQEVPSRTEIGIEDDKVFSFGSCECPAEVASLFESRTIIADDVVETEALSKLLHRFFVPIIQDPYIHSTRVNHLVHIFPRVLQNLERLGANRQEDVNTWGGLLRKREILQRPLMPTHVEVFADDANNITDEQVELKEERERSKPIKVGRADGKEPHASGQRQERKDADDV